MKETPRCHCRNVQFGTYANTVVMKAPFPLFDILGDEKPHRLVTIDTCIATEIGYLWHKGVITENSCCGHGKLPPSVVVADESIERMYELGYDIVGRTNEVTFARPKNTFKLWFYSKYWSI